MMPTPDALELGDQLEQLRRLRFGQRGRRLVEDQQPHVGEERLGDLDHLLMRARQIAAPCGRVADRSRVS